MPVPTNSLHWIADESLSTAIADYLQAERAAVDDEIEIMTTYGPFKKTQQEEQE
jgi:predicted N-acyltransferase